MRIKAKARAGHAGGDLGHYVNSVDTFSIPNGTLKVNGVRLCLSIRY